MVFVALGFPFTLQNGKFQWAERRSFWALHHTALENKQKLMYVKNNLSLSNLISNLYPYKVFDKGSS